MDEQPRWKSTVASFAVAMAKRWHATCYLVLAQHRGFRLERISLSVSPGQLLTCGLGRSFALRETLGALKYNMIGARGGRGREGGGILRKERRWWERHKRPSFTDRTLRRSDSWFSKNKYAPPTDPSSVRQILQHLADHNTCSALCWEETVGGWRFRPPAA